jgi:hypothetical protein
MKAYSGELAMPIEQTIPRRTGHHSAPLSFAQQLQKALDHVVARHAVLRTTFVPVDGIPIQVIADSRAAEMPLIDLRAWSDTARQAEVQRLLAETIRKSGPED